MKLYFKYLSIIIILVVAMLPSLYTFSYFESSVYCSFSDVNLQIKSTKSVGSRNCLDLISQLKTRKDEITKQLDNYIVHGVAQGGYSKSVRLKLTKQRSDIAILMGQVFSGINNFENVKFQSYKKQYFVKLRSIRSKLVSKQAVLTADLTNSIAMGDRVLVGKVIKVIGFNYQRIKLIEGILTSKTLDEMIPLLDTYQMLINSQLPSQQGTGTSE